MLDPRVGQNFGMQLPFCIETHNYDIWAFYFHLFSAIMFSQLKSNPQQFRQYVLTCDSKHLTSDLLAQLDKGMPSPEEMKKLAEFKSELNDLPDSEQYFCAVSSHSPSKEAV